MTTSLTASRCCASGPLPRHDRAGGALLATGAPLRVLTLGDAAPHEVYGSNVLLIRPDLHVAWAADRVSTDPDGLAARVTGNARR
jgi:hypothetical protein